MYAATKPMPYHDLAMEMVHQERLRQVQLWGHDKLRVEGPHGNNDARLRVLTEEFLEVVRALNDGEPLEHLREEIVQCAAVCVAFVEGTYADKTGV